jgi:signal transduction histidine kinase
MRLPDFIRADAGQIIGEWETFASTLVPAIDGVSPLSLRDHIEPILTFIAEDIESSQTGAEQTQKSRGEGPTENGYTAAETHAALRLAGGFNMDQMVSEFRALRASVIKLWSAEHPEMNSLDVLDLTRFNESIDQALTEAISHYTKKLNHSKDLFLGILGHDLRNPLQAILGAAELTLRIGTLEERQTMLVSQIVESTLRANEIVNNVVDLTRARFGSGLPVVVAPMDFSFVSRQMIGEMQAAYPKREITLEISGDTEGKWDRARIGQVFSNLIGNAVQYSFNDMPIVVTVNGGTEDVILSVHNQGVPIPRDKLGQIFDPLTRNSATGSMNLGLGLFITQEIVTAHGGTIDVTSSENSGTTFSARFPKNPASA